MCRIAKQLLAEKLMDDFYEEYSRSGQHEPQSRESLTERLKALLPVEQHEWLFRWEAEYAEDCGRELRQFADLVAGILLSNPCHEEGEGE